MMALQSIFWLDRVVFSRPVRRRMQQIQRMSAEQRQSQQVPQYRRLIRVSQRVVANARRVLQQTQKAHGKTLLDDLAIQALRKEIQHYCELGDRVINQARRRVLAGEQVPTDQKIYSLFESHTDLIKRGKTEKPIEFGHKVFLAESARGLITQYRVPDGNPAGEHHVEPSLQRHQQTFGHAPELYAGDRGFYSPTNLTAYQQAGVERISIPRRGGKKTPERAAIENSPVFKKGQRFRAGIEGRISVLFRGRGMKRCLAEGRQRFELFVGAAVLANNLLRIAALLRAKRKPPRPAAA